VVDYYPIGEDYGNISRDGQIIRKRNCTGEGGIKDNINRNGISGLFLSIGKGLAEGAFTGVIQVGDSESDGRNVEIHNRKRSKIDRKRREKLISCIVTKTAWRVKAKIRYKTIKKETKGNMRKRRREKNVATRNISNKANK
jgi:hypothetical protein